MVTIVVGEKCPNCKKMKRALSEKQVPFQEVRRSSAKGAEIFSEYRLRGVPVTALKNAKTEIARVGFSTKIVNEIAEAYRNTNARQS